MLKQLLEHSRQGHMVTLAMMITGVVMGQKAQLSVISSDVPVMDGSQAGRNCMVLMVGVMNKKRALPVLPDCFSVHRRLVQSTSTTLGT